VIFGVISVLT